ncbi:MAG: hypothetical protein UHK60_11135 [Acutalibacteraceae bacterium]|nr:hypothetical protein [Acutalibacteraceae bacterium]
MNFNFDLYEKAEAKEMGEREALELGAHELVIMDAREYKSEISGNVSLKVSVDIGGKDKQKGFFQKQYDNNTLSERKWPTGGVKYMSLKDEQLGFLKGFITALEKSNPNFKFNTKGTWEQLKGLKIAGQFGLEEYEKQDGSVGTTTKLVQFRSLDKLSEITIPKVKKLDGSYVEYEKYQPTTNNNTNSNLESLFANSPDVTTDELPF